VAVDSQLVWVVTNHKSLGLTLDRINLKLGLGKREFVMGLTFIGLSPSRVNEFDGIICLQSCQKDAEGSIYHRVLILRSDPQAYFLILRSHT
jgi:hypothetical protein